MDPGHRARIRRALAARDRAGRRLVHVLQDARAAGATFKELGDELDTSKQAVQQLLKRAGA